MKKQVHLSLLLLLGLSQQAVKAKTKQEKIEKDEKQKTMWDASRRGGYTSKVPLWTSPKPKKDITEDQVDAAKKAFDKLDDDFQTDLRAIEQEVAKTNPTYAQMLDLQNQLNFLYTDETSSAALIQAQQEVNKQAENLQWPHKAYFDWRRLEYWYNKEQNNEIKPFPYMPHPIVEYLEIELSPGDSYNLDAQNGFDPINKTTKPFTGKPTGYILKPKNAPAKIVKKTSKNDGAPIAYTLVIDEDAMPATFDVQQTRNQEKPVTIRTFRVVTTGGAAPQPEDRGMTRPTERKAALPGRNARMQRRQGHQGAGDSPTDR